MSAPIPKIISVDRIDGGVQIAFSNEQEGFYTHELLYSLLSQAEQPTLHKKVQPKDKG